MGRLNYSGLWPKIVQALRDLHNNDTHIQRVETEARRLVDSGALPPEVFKNEMVS